MKQEEKMYYQLIELKQKLSKEREDLQKETEKLQDQVSRFIAHIDFIEKTAKEIPEAVQKSLEKGMENFREVFEEIGKNAVQSITKQVYDNGIKGLKELNAEADRVQIQVKRYNKQNRLRTIYIGTAFFIGVSLTVAAIEYFVPRNNYTVYSIDGDIKKITPVKK